jgi:hypothetical protein
VATFGGVASLRLRLAVPVSGQHSQLGQQLMSLVNGRGCAGKWRCRTHLPGRGPGQGTRPSEALEFETTVEDVREARVQDGCDGLVQLPRTDLIGPGDHIVGGEPYRLVHAEAYGEQWADQLPRWVAVHPAILRRRHNASSRDLGLHLPQHIHSQPVLSTSLISRR